MESKKKKKCYEEPRGPDRIKDVDIENGLEDIGRGNGKLGRSETVSWTYIYTTKCKIDSYWEAAV